MGNYSVILADPAWQYQQKRVRGAAEKHYPTMSFAETCDLPVEDIAAPDCALFLWSTFAMLPEALLVIKEWGFRYKTVGFVWIKKNKEADSYFYGMGF